MNLDDIVEMMGRVPLFKGLNEDQLAWLAVCGEKAIFPSNREIIQKDMPGESGYLLVSGHAWRVEGPGLGQGPQALGAGSFIGETAMFIETVHGSTIVSDGEVRAIRFPRSLMRQLLEDDPSLSHHFADRISDRFVFLVEQIQHLRQQFEAGRVPGTDRETAGLALETKQTN